jgi:hypothetical protein
MSLCVESLTLSSIGFNLIIIWLLNGLNDRLIVDQVIIHLTEDSQEVLNNEKFLELIIGINQNLKILYKQ